MAATLPPLDRLARMLARAGLADASGTAVERERVLGGAAAHVLLEVDRDRSIWVERLRDRMLQRRALRVSRMRVVLQQVGRADHPAVHPVLPVCVAPATYAYPV